MLKTINPEQSAKIFRFYQKHPNNGNDRVTVGGSSSNNSNLIDALLSSKLVSENSK